MLTAQPNGLAVVGSLFLLGGFAVLGAQLLNRQSLANFPNSGFTGTAKTNAAVIFSVSAIIIGYFLQALASVVTVAFGPGLACLGIAMALALLLYLMLDETVTEMFIPAASVSSRSHQAALPPPAPVASLDKPAPALAASAVADCEAKLDLAG